MPGNERATSKVDPKEAANSLSDAAFCAKFVEPVLSRNPVPPSAGDLIVKYEGPGTLSDEHLEACYALIAQGRHHFSGTSRSFDPDRIRAEFREQDMRHILVLTPGGGLAAFCSFMVSEEDGIDVIFIYQIHVAVPFKRKGIGSMLMQVMEDVGRATGMIKTMLSVFVSNREAVAFYEQRAYRMHKEEPHPSTRKTVRPGYVVPNDWKPCYYMTAKTL